MANNTDKELDGVQLGSKMMSYRCPAELLKTVEYLRYTYPGGVTRFILDKLEEVKVDDRLFELLDLIKEKEEKERAMRLQKGK